MADLTNLVTWEIEIFLLALFGIVAMQLITGRISTKRSSIWEIHPVYGVEICTDPGNNCKVDSEQDWVPLSGSVGVEETNETRLWLPDEISKQFARPSATRQARTILASR